jgi:enhancing lycopene biosynthesis protein 2
LPDCELTVGKNIKSKDWPYSHTADEIKAMGAKTFEKDVCEIHTDSKYKIVSTPAFMKNATYYEIYEGIGMMVDQVLKLTDK